MPVRETDNLALTQQTSVWQECKRKRINGFFLEIPGGHVGFFEGHERQTIAMTEKLIRQGVIEQVQVVFERKVASAAWSTWFSDGLNILDLPLELCMCVPGLAQFIANEINARKGN
ncbi:MAG: hypothetical protein GY947_11200 [Rhodobacteraceae bacterium]|nr:hypothetical protein [Paracoccaceae bacterium]